MLTLDVVQRFNFDVGVVNFAATVADFQEFLMGNGHGANPQQRENSRFRSFRYRYGSEQSAITN
jgi:hypothetical protein